MGFWNRLFGANNETQGYVQQDSNAAVERLFGFDGSAQAVRYGNNVYTPDGRYLGNNMPNARNIPPPSSSEAPPSVFAQTPLQQRMREFTARKMREG